MTLGVRAGDRARGELDAQQEGGAHLQPMRDRGCNPKCQGLQPYVFELEGFCADRHVEQREDGVPLVCGLDAGLRLQRTWDR